MEWAKVFPTKKIAQVDKPRLKASTSVSFTLIIFGFGLFLGIAVIAPSG